MKKIILTLFTIFTLLNLTSCETYAQAFPYEDGFMYEYTYNSYPVRYVNGVAYYYCLYNNVWTWIIIDRMHYDRIIHHPRPIRYVHAHHYHPKRHYSHGVRPRPRQTRPDIMSPQPRHDRRGENINTRPSNNRDGGGRPGGQTHRGGGRR
jgi:hypothetical protein